MKENKRGASVGKNKEAERDCGSKTEQKKNEKRGLAAEQKKYKTGRWRLSFDG